MSMVQSPAADPRMARSIANSLRMMPEDGVELEKFAVAHKADPYLLSLAFNESNLRKRSKADQQMQAGQPQPVNEQALQSMRSEATPQQPMPADVGIAQLPMGDSNYAEGGIVAFAGGGPSGSAPSFDEALDIEGVTDPTQRAFLKSLYAQESSSGKKATTSNRGAVGGMQILPGTFKEVADPGMDIRNPLDNMRAGIRYGMKGYQAAKGDPVLAGAHYYGGPGGLQALAAGTARKDPVNPKAPDTRQYGESIAKRMTALLPIGSAQAAQPAAVPVQAAPAPADDTVYSDLGIPLYQGTPTPYAESPTKILKQIAAPVVKGVTKAAKFITSAPKTAAEIAEDRGPFSTGEYQGKSGDVEQDIGPATPPRPLADITPKEAIAAGKASMTPEERKESGFTSDDWLTLGFSLLSGKSPRALENLGTAGIATLAARQARTKAEMEARKAGTDIKTAEALARKYGAEAQRYEAEDKPQLQYQKAIDNAIAELAKDPEYKFAKTPAEKMQMENAARAKVRASFLSVYPELAATMGAGAGPALDLTKWGTPAKT